MHLTTTKMLLAAPKSFSYTPIILFLSAGVVESIEIWIYCVTGCVLFISRKPAPPKYFVVPFCWFCFLLSVSSTIFSALWSVVRVVVPFFVTRSSSGPCYVLLQAPIRGWSCFSSFSPTAVLFHYLSTLFHYLSTLLFKVNIHSILHCCYIVVTSGPMECYLFVCFKWYT